MIYAGKRLAERHPNLVILLIGIWLVAAPPALGVYFRNLTAKNDALPGPEASLELFLFNYKVYVAIVFATMSFIGMALIGVAICRMVRPQLHKR